MVAVMRLLMAKDSFGRGSFSLMILPLLEVLNANSSLRIRDIYYFFIDLNIL
jgi:hypothetical protein